jgi:hypothetical protein
MALPMMFMTSAGKHWRKPIWKIPMPPALPEATWINKPKQKENELIQV